AGPTWGVVPAVPAMALVAREGSARPVPLQPTGARAAVRATTVHPAQALPSRDVPAQTESLFRAPAARPVHRTAAPLRLEELGRGRRQCLSDGGPALARRAPAARRPNCCRRHSPPPLCRRWIP